MAAVESMGKGAAAAARAATAPARPGLSATGLFGLSAGLTGVGLTVFNAVRESLGTDDIRSNLVLGPATYSLGAGMGFLFLAERGGFTNQVAQNAVRGGALALVLGGLAGAVIGTIPTFYNPHDERARRDTRIQPPRPFQPINPTSPAQLEGIELAAAEVITTNGGMKRVSVYMDPATARKLETRTLAEAISSARAAAQADATDRAHAVLQTADGAWWVAQVTGDLDQVDGRWYTRDTDFDRRYSPNITKKQPSLRAIVGIEHHYAYNPGLDPAAPAQQVEDVPAAIPSLPAPSPTPGATPGAAATPTPAPAGGNPP